MVQRKILCLHGAMLSSTLFRLQLAPYLARLDKELNCSFTFVDGPVPSPPHASVAAFYDEPCYRYFHWAPSPTPFSMTQVRAAEEWLQKVIKEQGPFDGVLGFSQGSIISLMTMIHHADANPEDPPDALFRFAILFSCPYMPRRDADGSPLTFGKIQIPSLHICGEGDDDWFEGSKEQFEDHCENGSATMITHNGGHLVPKDKPMVDKIIREIKKLLQKADV